MKTVDNISSKTKLYEVVSEHLEFLLRGRVLVIDPSIGSSSSAPGWAFYAEGKLITAGTIYTGGSHLPLWQRARSLGQQLKELNQELSPNLLIYEDIPATSNFNANAQASLLKAVGVVLASTATEAVIGIHPASWKNYVRPTYTKGDKEDAVEIGHVAISLAQHIESTRSSVPSGVVRARRRYSR